LTENTSLTGQRSPSSTASTLFFLVGAIGGYPIPVVRSEGFISWDADGKRYIDFSSR